MWKKSMEKQSILKMKKEKEKFHKSILKLCWRSCWKISKEFYDLFRKKKKNITSFKYPQ